MRATDRWAIEERGIAVARADGARRSRAWPTPSPSSSRDGPRRRRLRAGQQRRRRLRRGTAAARGGPRGPGARRSCTPTSCAGTRGANAERLPGAPPGAVRGRAPRRRARSSSTRCSERASPASRGPRPPPPSPRSNAATPPVVAADVPSGVDASTGEVGGRGGPRRADGDVRRGQARPVGQPGQGPRGRGPGHRHRDPRGRPGPGAGRRPDRRHACSTSCPCAAPAGRSSRAATCWSPAAPAA